MKKASEEIPLDTQGADFNGGALWAATSTSKWGKLEIQWGKPNRETHAFGPGVEEIQFAGDCLWAVFEAGSLKYPDPSFPVVAGFDPGLFGESDQPNPECTTLH